MKTRDLDTIKEDQFDLNPVLKAAKSHDKEAIQAYFDQGYALSWQDHHTNQTLLFALGKGCIPIL